MPGGGWVSGPGGRKERREKWRSCFRLGGQKKDRPFGRSFPPMSRTARKQAPEGATPALHGHSNTCVRFCQPPILIAELAATVSGCWGLPGSPGGSFPGQREHLSPPLITCAPRPAGGTEQSRRAIGIRTQPPHQPCAPPSPSGGRGRGGKRENPTELSGNRTGHGAGAGLHRRANVVEHRPGPRPGPR